MAVLHGSGQGPPGSFEDGDPESRRCARLPSQRSAVVAHVPEDAATEARPENPREYPDTPASLASVAFSFRR